MPWLPQTFTVPALERIQGSARRGYAYVHRGLVRKLAAARVHDDSDRP
jgi:hypothetical protein